MKSQIIKEEDEFDVEDPEEDEIEHLVGAYCQKQPGYKRRHFCSYKLFDDNDNFIAGASFLIRAEMLFLDDLAVVENERLKGYGSKMLKEIEEFAISNGCEKAETSIYQSLPFYLKNGYEVKYTREYADKRLNQYKLEKKLK